MLAGAWRWGHDALGTAAGGRGEARPTPVDHGRHAPGMRPPVDAYVRLTITDTLSALADGNHAFNLLAKVTRTFWYRLPRHWVHAGRLCVERRRQLIDQLYAPEDRLVPAVGCAGDGAAIRYVILELSEHVLSEEEVPRRPWLSDRAAFYAWREGDVIEEVIPANL